MFLYPTVCNCTEIKFHYNIICICTTQHWSRLDTVRSKQAEEHWHQKLKALTNWLGPYGNGLVCLTSWDVYLYTVRVRSVTVSVASQQLPCTDSAKNHVLLSSQNFLNFFLVTITDKTVLAMKDCQIKKISVYLCSYKNWILLCSQLSIIRNDHWLDNPKNPKSQLKHRVLK